jgi:hypothetical protein
MNIKEFNNIFDFSDVLTSSLKEYEYKYNDFCDFCKENPNVPCFLCIYEFKNEMSSNYLLNVIECLGSVEEWEYLFEDGRIICTINQDFKIENYSIKKA